MTHELLDIASNHADDKEVVATALNAPQGKRNQVVDHGEGTFSRFKKKKKNDKRRRDDNFITMVERKTLCPKGNLTKPTPSKDHFEISAIMSMGPITNLKGVQRVTGHLAALSRFIA
jgi:hypothetical protein